MRGAVAHLQLFKLGKFTKFVVPWRKGVMEVCLSSHYARKHADSSYDEHRLVLVVSTSIIRNTYVRYTRADPAAALIGTHS